MDKYFLYLVHCIVFKFHLTLISLHRCGFKRLGGTSEASEGIVKDLKHLFPQYYFAKINYNKMADPGYNG
jgi:hypothetical protein